ncbi:hypothetical protein [Roseixanthobacter glucoisosaccharinicivorans]|uniref:hypothetical protein n=1 Tax=Roseixanthobacter glucoisosaccharinicivorans TaxID=3119923 RepID=UPI00372642E9
MLDTTAPEMMGHNNPPEPTPYELSKAEIEELVEEAKGWLDGEPVKDQAVADKIGLLKGLLRKARQTADGRRKEEVKPLDDAKAEIQARYNALIGDTKKDGKGIAILAEEYCDKALEPFLKALAAEKEAKVKAAREEAEKAAAAAQEAIRAAREADFATQEAAEALLRDAKKAETAANRAEKDTARVAGAGRSIGLRSSEVLHVTDAIAALRDVGLTDGVKAALLTAAREYRVEWGRLPAGVTATTERGL